MESALERDDDHNDQTVNLSVEFTLAAIEHSYPVEIKSMEVTKDQLDTVTAMNATPAKGNLH